MGGYSRLTYVVLPKESTATPRSLQSEFDAFVERRVPQRERNDIAVGMTPVSNVMTDWLNSTLFSGANAGVSITMLLMAFGVLVLSMACLNYANLAAAQATHRAKEVGLRKVIGADRTQVAIQYLLETGLLTCAAAVLSIGIIGLLSPAIYDTAHIDVTLAISSGPLFWLFVAGVLVGTTLLAGSYPAFILSRTRPVVAMRQGAVRVSPRFVQMLFVGAQLLMASFLLVTVIVMYIQTSDLRTRGLGIDANPRVVITNFNRITKLDSGTFEDQLRSLPQVQSVTEVGFSLPWNGNPRLSQVERNAGEEASEHAYLNFVGYDFFSTMGQKVVAGRVFGRQRGEDRPYQGAKTFDTNRPLNVVIDRALSGQLGFATPQDAVGKIVYNPTAGPDISDQPLRIIGVVENKPLHFSGLGATANIYWLNTRSDYVVVKLAGRDIPGALKTIEGVWQRLAPGQVFQYDFEDQLFSQGYRQFGYLSQAFVGLAVFAFVISIIGLIGMAAHASSRRRHEIGVRKTLGADTGRIVVMLLKDYSKPVLIANVVAWPAAYLAANAYLSIFIHRIPLTLLPFALSLLITLLVAWGSVGFQSWRAARVKPAKVLRYE
jgi:putative ABC transport system permease protein